LLNFEKKLDMAYLNKTKGVDAKLINKAYDKAMSMKKGGKCNCKSKKCNCKKK
jgi:hypothetical protein